MTAKLNVLAYANGTTTWTYHHDGALADFSTPGLLNAERELLRHGDSVWGVANDSAGLFAVIHPERGNEVRLVPASAVPTDPAPSASAAQSTPAKRIGWLAIYPTTRLTGELAATGSRIWPSEELARQHAACEALAILPIELPEGL